MPKNTPTSNRRRAASLSRTLKAIHANRRAVRSELAHFLRHKVAPYPPDNLSPAIENQWFDEVRKIADRIERSAEPPQARY
jgi:hypothetical protein